MTTAVDNSLLFLRGKNWNKGKKTNCEFVRNISSKSHNLTNPEYKDSEDLTFSNISSFNTKKFKVNFWACCWVTFVAHFQLLPCNRCKIWLDFSTDVHLPDCHSVSWLTTCSKAQCRKTHCVSTAYHKIWWHSWSMEDSFQRFLGFQTFFMQCDNNRSFPLSNT